MTCKQCTRDISEGDTCIWCQAIIKFKEIKS